MDNLTPCPFCGDIPRFILINTKEEKGYLSCKCGVETKIATIPELIALWNRRTEPLARIGAPDGH